MKNKKPIIFMVLLLVACFTIGGTIAYYTTSDTFNNEFNTLTYDIETQENFVSPENWTPGTTTPKTVIATNKGTTPAAVRIKLTPSWVDKDGNPLPLKDSDDNDAAIINFATNYENKWVYHDGYYYYKRALNENQSTTSLLKSVTFNPDVNIDIQQNCVRDNETHKTTCSITSSGYPGGIFTLEVKIETCQYDQYKGIWNTNVSLNDPILADGTLMVHDDDSSETFGKSINRDSFEIITTVDNKNVPAEAIDSWDVSSEQNGSVMAWYLDADNDGKYELYIGQEDGVKANPDSAYAFYSFQNVERIDLTNFDTSSVTDMYYMFYYAGYNAQTFNIVGLTNFDTSSVTDMDSMFYCAGYNATTWSIGDLSNWDTSNVMDMSSMFYCAGYSAATWDVGDLSRWDTSGVISMSQMFAYAGRSATSWSVGDLSRWDTSSVISMSSMFSSAGRAATTWNIGNLSRWDTSNVIGMGNMFNYAGYSATTWSIGDISRWNTSNVTSMINMFQYAGYSAPTFNIGDLSRWDTSNVTTMERMFANAWRNSTTWDIGDLSGWNTSNVKNMGYMFYYAGFNTTTWDIGNLSRWDTSSVTNMTYMFHNSGRNATTWDIGDLSNWDTSSVTNMSNMFSNAGYNATTWNSIGTLKVYATNIQLMFLNCPKAKATLNIYSNPTSYANAFNSSATVSGSGIIVNYSSATTNIDAIIATQIGNSNVVKGIQLD